MAFFDETIECLSRKDLECLQPDKLQEMAQRLEGENHFYTEKLQSGGMKFRDLSSLDELKLVPFTTKSDLMETQAESPPFGANLSYPESAYSRFHQTSGTT